jgi:hypothetical protein
MKSGIKIGILLLLVSGFVFVSYDKSFNNIKLMSDDDYKDYEQQTPSPEALRELDRINKKLNVNIDNLADPETRRISQMARDFVIEENLNQDVIKWQ